jgi:esterase/lipase superfamily enzyme
MNERYIKWWTAYLSREFEMLVFGDGRGLPLILFPTSFGRYSQNKDFHIIDAIAPYIDGGKVTVYCPDAIDLESFYNKAIHPADRMRTHNAYENVIVRDVFDFARREGSCHRVGVCGASLGAYHALNIVFRHPDAVSHLISMSGAFDISDFLTATTTTTFTSTVSTIICRTSPIRGNSITWASFSPRANGITRATKPCACLRSSIQRESIIGWTIENGAATIEITGARCCRTICRSCENLFVHRFHRFTQIRNRNPPLKSV